MHRQQILNCTSDRWRLVEPAGCDSVFRLIHLRSPVQRERARSREDANGTWMAACDQEHLFFELARYVPSRFSVRSSVGCERAAWMAWRADVSHGEPFMSLPPLGFVSCRERSRRNVLTSTITGSLQFVCEPWFDELTAEQVGKGAKNTKTRRIPAAKLEAHHELSMVNHTM